VRSDMIYIECQLTFLDDHQAIYADDDQFTGANKVRGIVGDDELSLRTVRKLNEWVQMYPGQFHNQELLLLGLHLYRIAFDSPKDPDRALKKAFECTLDRLKTSLNKTPQTRMRIRLIFNKEAENLAALPWEFLALPEGRYGKFLVQRAEMILTRFVPDQDWGGWKTDEADGKLRILLITAQPQELGEIKNRALVQQIRSLQSEHIDVKVFDQRATLDLLRKEIGTSEFAGYRPHIVHFMGHGLAGKLAVLKEERQFIQEKAESAVRQRQNQTVLPVEEAQWLEIESVKSLFEEHKPRVVFLHACEGAAPDSLQAFSSTARELAYSNIPAVIAMQYTIENDEAERFAMSFYKNLRQGRPVDEAVTQARYELGRYPGRDVWNDRSFGTPVIYLQTAKPIILAPPERSPSPPVTIVAGDSIAAIPVKAPCPSNLCPGYVITTRGYCEICKREFILCPKCNMPALTDESKCTNGHILASNPAARAVAGDRGDVPERPTRGTANDDNSFRSAKALGGLQKTDIH
jgi:CHAT domain